MTREGSTGAARRYGKVGGQDRGQLPPGLRGFLSAIIRGTVGRLRGHSFAATRQVDW
jgi:hypothetical protein